MDFPCWMYGPNEAAQIFDEGDEIPKGWVDHPAKVKQAETPAEPKAAPQRRTKKAR